MPEQQQTLGYGAAADTYWRNGWRGILPIRRGHKKSPPTGFTGRAGNDPSYPDVMSWAELYPDGNLCLRLPDGIIGIDVDAYGAKTGARTLKEAEHRWGELPPASRSTSRRDGVSGIRLYRIPPGTQLAEGIEFAELGIGDIEIVQHHHRYVLAWPSIHPEGRGYQWLNDTDQLVGIPESDNLPPLPDTWITSLGAQKSVATLHGHTYRIKDALTEGEPSTPVVDRLRQAIKELNLPGHSRHDTTRGHVLALLRLGTSGESGVNSALLALGEMFIALVAPDRAGGKDEAIHEFRAMVTGDGAARELAQPSLTDWMRNITIDTTAAKTEPPQDPEHEPHNHIVDIERGFWDARESLQMVYTTAMARMCSPWAVLAHCAARALTQVRPCITLPPLIGGPGSLNWFAAITAVSGGGKGSAAAAARLLVPGHVQQHNLGSGEGLVAAFAGDMKDPDSRREAILFSADEIDTLTALGSRTGATLMSIMRSAFSAEQLGFSYADKDKRRNIDAHTYRLTLVVSVQPERATALLNDTGGGTPQRFMWFPGTDPRITASPPWESGALTLPPPSAWLYPIELTIPDEARELILTERVKAMRGQSDALDGHALFVREKIAYALTVLDGRTDMTSEDWELSGIASDISTYTRELVLDAIKDASAREAEARGVVRGIEIETSDAERDHRRSERGQRVLRWLLDKLDKACDDGMSRQEITRAMSSRDRSILQSVLVVAVDDGLIKRSADGVRWVKL
jgi:hypothetical protein